MTSNPKAKRPSDKVLDELGKDIGWDIDKHLSGCLAAYQQNASYGTAVYFALEAIAGIGREGLRMAESNELPQGLTDSEWGLAPTKRVPVPWIWIRALTEAWERYKDGDEGLGRAFGQEGGGRGKSPVSKRLDTVLDHRAIAVWIWDRVQKEKGAGRKYRIEDAIGEAADHFHRSDFRIRKIWNKHGRHVKRVSQK